MADDLYVISIWIKQERCIIVRMVLGANARRTVICSARCNPCYKEGIDSHLRSCAKREMRTRNHWNSLRKPNITRRIGAFTVAILYGKTNRVGGVVYKGIAESRQTVRIKFPTFGEVTDRNSHVIDQNVSLKFCPVLVVLVTYTVIQKNGRASVQTHSPCSLFAGDFGLVPAIRRAVHEGPQWAESTSWVKGYKDRASAFRSSPIDQLQRAVR